MSESSVTERIAAPAARLWELLVDIRGRRGWLAAAGRVEAVTPPPFGAGTVWREAHRMPDGAEVTEEYQVVECRPGECFVIESAGRGASYRTTYTLTPVEAGVTDVTVVQEGHAEGVRGRLLEVVLGGLAAVTAEGALRQELADLARAAAPAR